MTTTMSCKYVILVLSIVVFLEGAMPAPIHDIQMTQYGDDASLRISRIKLARDDNHMEGSFEFKENLGHMSIEMHKDTGSKFQGSIRFQGIPAERPTVEGANPDSGRPAERPTAEGVNPDSGRPAERPTAEGVNPDSGRPAERPTAEGVNPDSGRPGALISCGDPGVPTNGNRNSNGFNAGNVVRYTCNEGYNLQGVSSRTCGQNRQWSGRQPTCHAIVEPASTPDSVIQRMHTNYEQVQDLAAQLMNGASQ